MTSTSLNKSRLENKELRYQVKEDDVIFISKSESKEAELPVLASAAFKYVFPEPVNGLVPVTLDWSFIKKSSAVFASVTEVTESGEAFLGSAVYSVCNIVPKDDSVTILVNIEWDAPLLLRIDCFAICTEGAICR